MAETATSRVKYSPDAQEGTIAAADANCTCGGEPPPTDPMLASMQPDELRQAMDDMGYTTQSALARAIGVDRSTVSLWLEGRVGVPRPIAKLLRLLPLHEATLPCSCGQRLGA